jgi:hypothetical protein
MHREIVDWLTPNISAQISSVMLLRSYPQVTISASRKVSPRGRPDPLTQGLFEQFGNAYFKLVELLPGQT